MPSVRRGVKTLLISRDYFPPHTGGISKMMLEIMKATGLRDSCCLTGVGRPDLEVDAKLSTYRRPFAFSDNRLVEGCTLIATLMQILLLHRPSLVQLATLNESYLGLLLKRHFGLPFIVYLHGNEVLKLAVEGASGWDKPRIALREASRVVAVSNFTAGLAIKAGAPEQNISIIHPGCDAEFFSPKPVSSDWLDERFGIPDSSATIVTVGNLVRRKGHDNVIRALRKIESAVGDVRYLIIGDGPYRADLERLASELGVSNLVVFAGRVSNEWLPYVYSGSDVFVMASRQEIENHDVEGFGLVFLEAGACELVVVGGRSGGIPDAIANGETGWLVDPEDIFDIAATISKVLLNRSEAQSMGQRARERVVQDFSWTRFADNIRQVIEP